MWTGQNLSRWDQFVKEHPYGWITHLSDWGKVLTGSGVARPGFYLALVEEQDSKIKAGLVLYPTTSFFFGLNYISAPLSTTADPLINSEHELNLLLNKAMEILLKSGGQQIKIKPLHATEYFTSTPFQKINEFYYHMLDLNQSEEQLWKKFHRSCIRQHINRAVKAGLTVRKIEHRNELITFYRLYRMVRKNHGLPAIPFAYFLAIWDNFQSKENVHFFVAEFHGQAVAALMALSFKHVFSAEALGWDTAYRWLSPALPLFWEAIKFARATGHRIFDFGRTPTDNLNLLTFKRRWGTEEKKIPLMAYPTDETAPKFGRARAVLYPLGHQLFKSSPNALYELLSKIAYKYHVE